MKNFTLEELIAAIHKHHAHNKNLQFEDAAHYRDMMEHYKNLQLLLI